MSSLFSHSDEELKVNNETALPLLFKPRKMNWDFPVEGKISVMVDCLCYSDGLYSYIRDDYNKDDDGLGIIEYAGHPNT